jgi:hypothetical protein
MFKLRDLEFSVEKATITGSIQNGELSCFINGDMTLIVKDGENRKPYLYHQGLMIPVNAWKELQEKNIEFQTSDDESYRHPEIGILYVFGHEPTENNIIEFGAIEENTVEFKWAGMNDAYWDDEYGSYLPFELESKLETINA